MRFNEDISSQIVRGLLESHKFSCVMALLPPEMRAHVFNWGQEQINNNDIFTDKDGGKGREPQDEVHTTVLYGLHQAGADQVLTEIVRETPAFVCRIQPISLFRSEGYDVVKMGVISPELHALNARLRTLPCTNSFPTYNPHITIAYVRSGAGDKLEGHSPWDDTSKMGSSTIVKDGVFKVEAVVFSSFAGGEKRVLKLGKS